jgi:hypothetical protein
MKEDRRKHVQGERNKFQQLEGRVTRFIPRYWIPIASDCVIVTHSLFWSDASVATNCVTSLRCTADNELILLLRNTGPNHTVTGRGIAAVTAEIQREISSFLSPSFTVFLHSLILSRFHLVPSLSSWWNTELCYIYILHMARVSEHRKLARSDNNATCITQEVP